jgi:branched-chain amino acid transport system substrate-binding protein
MPRLLRSSADALIVWGRPSSAVGLIFRLRKAGVQVPVLVPGILVLPEVAARGAALGEMIGAAPLDLGAETPPVRDFVARFRRQAGMEPSYVAAYAYDAARLVLDAIERAGLNRVRIRDELARGRYRGLAGEFVFNSLGGRREAAVLMGIRDGVWIRR